MLSIVSCQNSQERLRLPPDDSNTNRLDDRIGKIYEIYDSYGVSANYRNPLNIDNVTQKEDIDIATKSVSLKDKQVHANYTMTHICEIGDVKIRVYEYDLGYAIFREDGSLKELYDETGLFRLDTDQIMTQDELDAALRSEIGKWFDITDFQLKEVPDKPIDNISNSDSIVYTKEVNGFVVDEIFIDIYADGTVKRLSGHEKPITDKEHLIQLGKIREEYEKEIIVLKLKDLFEDEKRTLASNEYEVNDRVAYMFKGELYILYYGLKCDIANDDGPVSSVYCDLLVPVSVLVS